MNYHKYIKKIYDITSKYYNKLTDGNFLLSDTQRYMLKMAVKRKGILGLPLFLNSELDVKYPEEKPRCMPIVVQIEITNRCNLTCKSCYRDSAKIHPDLRLERIKEIMNLFNEALFINIVGKGEPLLHPQITEIIKHISKQRMEFSLFSNLHTKSDNILKEIVKSKVDLLFISIDATTERLFTEIRQGGNLNLVLDNLNKINEFKRKYRSKNPRLVLNFVPTKQNFRQMPELVKFAKEHQFFRIHIIKMRRGGNNGEYYENNLLDDSDMQTEAETLLRWTRLLAEREGIYFTADRDLSYFKDPNRYTSGRLSRLGNCILPWRMMSIDADGTILPGCCSISDGFANINKDNLKEVWNSPLYQKFRKMVLEKELNCDNCAIKWKKLKK